MPVLSRHRKRMDLILANILLVGFILVTASTAIAWLMM
jgi:hypothetical protein